MTALRFAEQGSKVVVAARGEPGLRSLVTEIENDGGTATAVVADVADPGLTALAGLERGVVVSARHAPARLERHSSAGAVLPPEEFKY